MTIRRSVLAAIVVLGSVSAFAQVQIRFVEYSAKFLCGVSEAARPGAAPVRPGIYETSINIHNPQLPLNPLPSVTFVKKVVLALPEGEKPVPPSKFRVDKVEADFAEQVDCRIIREMLGPAGAAPFNIGSMDPRTGEFCVARNVASDPHGRKGPGFTHSCSSPPWGRGWVRG
jgi:hypothetical protein